MFEEKYQNFNNTEKENFKRLASLLLGKTFIVNRVYDTKQGMFRGNADYRFIDRNLEIFKEYFDYAGFKLQKDSNYEVIYIENELAYNKAKLDKNTTIFLYGLRLKFDEDRENVKLNTDTIVTVADILKTLMDVGAYPKKPTDNDIRASLSKLIQFNIIQKVEGPLENPETKIVILPSILFAVTNDKIMSLSSMITKLEENSEPEEEENETIDENVID